MQSLAHLFQLEYNGNAYLHRLGKDKLLLYYDATGSASNSGKILLDSRCNEMAMRGGLENLERGLVHFCENTKAAFRIFR